MKFNVILFNNFETMDVFGPVEVMGMADKYMENQYENKYENQYGNQFEIEFYSEGGGIITSSQNVKVVTMPLKDIKDADILLIPGGLGVRNEVYNQKLIEELKELAIKAKYVLTVCTGSALLAKTGLLKGLKATSNKMSFNWVIEQDKEVQWTRRARWVNDGKYYTSSGISAGIDMALGFISDIMGAEVADKVSKGMEYIWNNDKTNDPFC